MKKLFNLQLEIDTPMFYSQIVYIVDFDLIFMRFSTIWQILFFIHFTSKNQTFKNK
jgi:hypothetical protein